MPKNAKKPIIGIAGLGMVGGQAQKWFKSKRLKTFGYDKFKNIGKAEDLLPADMIFLCLPTPHKENHKGGVDLSSFKEIISLFSEPKIFVIKSTIPIGSTEELQKEFSEHYFFHSPEFLTEATAWKDFSKPIFQIIGCTEKSKKLAKSVLKILPPAKEVVTIPSSASEIFKFVRNAFFAVKVIFANQVYDLCEASCVDYDQVKDLMLSEPWIGGHHLEVIHKGYRGFGGKCLPKDLKTLIKFFKYKGIKPELFEAVDKINHKLIADQKLEDTLKTLWLNNKS
ncbi:UDP-glucose/GDP-mannose dehydrogenase family protein [Candidatus Parcubacteria bacterium]|nr:MAG: UDP-glucose/GDP-mannose dehydrogenase family protein [Candidatus Parcubacteria bacterium]